jgi:flagellar hook-associated protein 3 FlgL
MAITPVNIGRVSQNMQANLLVSGMQRSLVKLLQSQEQLSTGQQINRPSDDPINAAATIRMEDFLGAQKQYLDNIDNATKVMDIGDGTIGSINDLMVQAHNLALENVGSTATSDQRSSAATLIESILSQMVSVGNTEYLGSYIFAGQKNTTPPFEKDHNLVKFSGDLQSITVQVAPDASENISLTADEVFGSGKGKIRSYKDLAPAANLYTRLSDIDGALGQGIRTGTLNITGSVIGSVNVDLNGSTNLGDVVRKINNALPATAQAALSPDGRHLVLTSTNAGETLTVLESGQGTTAHDLGLYTPVAQASPVTSSDIAPRLQLQSSVAALNGGAGIDLNSGIVITNGQNSIAVNFATAGTMQDIINAINTSGVGVRAQLNETGNGIDIISELAGARLSIGENGGTTAEDLGIRTLRGATPLSDLNEGLGVHPVAGDDFQITASNGATILVDADGAVTFQDIIGKINAAATAAGVPVVAGLATTGNGIVLTDNTGGAGGFKVERANLSNVADELGILKTAATGSNQIAGDDVNPTKEESVFTYLIDLRDGLRNNDPEKIQVAGQQLETYMTRLNQFQGKLGYMAKGMDSRKTRTEDAVTSTKALVSSIKDLDFTEAITRFQNLQTTLQANLQSGGQILKTTLLNYLG